MVWFESASAIRLGPVWSRGTWQLAQPMALKRPLPRKTGAVSQSRRAGTASEPAYSSTWPRLRSSISGAPPVGISEHPAVDTKQFSSENSDDVIPMSPWNALATWARTVGSVAFQPNRPTPYAPRSTSQTRWTRPETPSPSASSGSASAASVASGTASKSPIPITWFATRGESASPEIGP